MNISTTNPIIIDGKEESTTDLYIPASGPAPKRKPSPHRNKDGQIVFSSAEGDAEEDYDGVQDFAVDGLNIQTRYPVIVNNDVLTPDDYFANANGKREARKAKRAIKSLKKDTKKTPSTEEQKKAAEKGLFWDKVKGGWQKFKSNPATQFGFQQLATYLGGGYGDQGGYGYGDQGGYDPYNDPNNPNYGQPEPMSTGAKVALGILAAAAVGLIIYGVVKKKGSSN